jgi:acyl-CoA reductase-like NAD-dependent aldehyde dehydrogenase
MTMRKLERSDWQILIDGEWTASDSVSWFDVHEPATGEPMARVVAGTADDVHRAVRSARNAYDGDWRHRTATERGRMLARAATLVREHTEELATLEAREVGKPIEQARAFDMRATANIFDYFAGLADKLSGEFFLQGPINAYTIPEPYGVVGAIIPFNWPPIHVAGKAAPALAAGNTIVLKPAEQAPLTVLRLTELLQQIFPPGVINCVPGLGSEAGSALIGHPGIGKFSFTGSTNTGRAVLKIAADNLTPALLELGGKNPLVIFPDADLNAALEAAVEGMFFNQGEACSAASLIIVHHSLKKEFVRRFALAAERIRLGDPLDEQTQLGPLVTRQQQERVLNYIEIGKSEGATIAAEGHLPQDPRLKNGFFVRPTVFDNVDIRMRIAQEEIFGPVCCALGFETYDEAMSLANGTEFGLVSSVYTRDMNTAQRAARDIEAGVVMINNYLRGYLGTPFGGMKASGFGREHGLETIQEFVRAKNVRFPSGFGEVPQWNVAKELTSE